MAKFKIGDTFKVVLDNEQEVVLVDGLSELETYSVSYTDVNNFTHNFYFDTAFDRKIVSDNSDLVGYIDTTNIFGIYYIKYNILGIRNNSIGYPFYAQSYKPITVPNYNIDQTEWLEIELIQSISYYQKVIAWIREEGLSTGLCTLRSTNSSTGFYITIDWPSTKFDLTLEIKDAQGNIMTNTSASKLQFNTKYFVRLYMTTNGTYVQPPGYGTDPTITKIDHPKISYINLNGYASYASTGHPGLAYNFYKLRLSTGYEFTYDINSTTISWYHQLFRFGGLSSDIVPTVTTACLTNPVGSSFDVSAGTPLYISLAYLGTLLTSMTYHQPLIYKKVINTDPIDLARFGVPCVRKGAVGSLTTPGDYYYDSATGTVYVRLVDLTTDEFTYNNYTSSNFNSSAQVYYRYNTGTAIPIKKFDGTNLLVSDLTPIVNSLGAIEIIKAADGLSLILKNTYSSINDALSIINSKFTIQNTLSNAPYKLRLNAGGSILFSTGAIYNTPGSFLDLTNPVANVGYLPLNEGYGKTIFSDTGYSGTINGTEGVDFVWEAQEPATLEESYIVKNYNTLEEPLSAVIGSLWTTGNITKVLKKKGWVETNSDELIDDAIITVECIEDLKALPSAFVGMTVRTLGRRRYGEAGVTYYNRYLGGGLYRCISTEGALSEDGEIMDIISNNKLYHFRNIKDKGTVTIMDAGALPNEDISVFENDIYSVIEKLVTNDYDIIIPSNLYFYVGTPLNFKPRYGEIGRHFSGSSTGYNHYLYTDKAIDIIRVVGHHFGSSIKGITGWHVGPNIYGNECAVVRVGGDYASTSGVGMFSCQIDIISLHQDKYARSRVAATPYLYNPDFVHYDNPAYDLSLTTQYDNVENFTNSYNSYGAHGVFLDYYTAANGSYFHETTIKVLQVWGNTPVKITRNKLFTTTSMNTITVDSYGHSCKTYGHIENISFSKVVMYGQSGDSIYWSSPTGSPETFEEKCTPVIFIKDPNMTEVDFFVWDLSGPGGRSGRHKGGNWVRGTQFRVIGRAMRGVVGLNSPYLQGIQAGTTFTNAAFINSIQGTIYTSSPNFKSNFEIDLSGDNLLRGNRLGGKIGNYVAKNSGYLTSPYYYGCSAFHADVAQHPYSGTDQNQTYSAITSTNNRFLNDVDVYPTACLLESNKFRSYNTTEDPNLQFVELYLKAAGTQAGISDFLWKDASALIWQCNNISIDFIGANDTLVSTFYRGPISGIPTLSNGMIGARGLSISVGGILIRLWRNSSTVTTVPRIELPFLFARFRTNV